MDKDVARMIEAGNQALQRKQEERAEKLAAIQREAQVETENTRTLIIRQALDCGLPVWLREYFAWDDNCRFSDHRLVIRIDGLTAIHPYSVGTAPVGGLTLRYAVATFLIRDNDCKPFLSEGELDVGTLEEAIALARQAWVQKQAAVSELPQRLREYEERQSKQVEEPTIEAQLSTLIRRMIREEIEANGA